jgi:hypothetical protein
VSRSRSSCFSLSVPILPEAIVKDIPSVVVFDESAKRFLHELLALAEIRKDRAPEDKIAAVDADVRVGYRLAGIGTGRSVPITECLCLMQISRHAIMYNESRRAPSVPPRGNVNEVGSN